MICAVMARRASCFVGQNGRLMGATSLTLVAVRRMEKYVELLFVDALEAQIGEAVGQSWGNASRIDRYCG